jgi:hypothetical protein
MSLRSLALAAGALLIAAPAYAAYTTGTVNLRTGPGTGYPVVATAAPGQWIGVRDCTPNWCHVNFSGVQGWMSANFIGFDQDRYVEEAPPPPPPAYIEPYPYYQGYYPYAPAPYLGFSFGYSNYHHHHRRPW